MPLQWGVWLLLALGSVPTAASAQWRSDLWSVSPEPAVVAPSEADAALRLKRFAAPGLFRFNTADLHQPSVKTTHAAWPDDPVKRGAVKGALVGGAITGGMMLVYFTFTSGWRHCFSPSDAHIPCPIAELIVAGYVAVPGAVLGAMYGAGEARERQRKQEPAGGSPAP